MKVLLYGFEPFLDLKDNPSEQVVKALAGKKIAGGSIDTLILPVEYRSIEKLLLSKIRQTKPGLVLGLGLYQGIPKLGVTKTALNLRFALAKDDAGKAPQGKIDGKSPDGMFMSAPSEGIVEYLNGKGVPAMLMMAPADSYACNLSMFVAARESKKTGFACGFVHLPFSEEFIAKNPSRNAASMSLATMTKGIELAIRYCLEHK